MEADYEKLWRDALIEVESHVSKANFSAWFRGTWIDRCENGIIYVNTPNNFAHDWLSTKFNKIIANALRNIDENIRHVNFSIVSKAPSNIGVFKPASLRQTGGEEQQGFSELFLDTESNLNPKYTFDSFVVASFNEVAHAAALTVSQNVGTAYNPLFVYGGVGLGKTHLLQAIGNEIKRSDPKKKVYYLTSEKFANEYVSSIQNGNINTFKEKYRKYNLLIVDDIQFFSDKLKIQEEFFHVFNSLYDSCNQIVFSSDKPPQHIVGLEDRLRSRFEGGMMVDVSPPEYEARLAILKSKSLQKNYPLTDEIIDYIASTIKSNIRELEGALNSIIGHSKITSKIPSLIDVEKILRKKIKPVKTITADRIVKSISDYFNITEKILMEKTRRKEVVKPRQIAMYLLRSDLHTSYPHIGRRLGQKDHTTAIHAYKKINNDLKNDKKLEQEINNIRDLMFKGCV